MSATTYDDIVYPSYPYPQSHPENLATVARLFGLVAPSTAGCRVLELGCAAGGNLLPIAEAFPDATLLGVDLSPRQVEIGRQAIQALGRTNLELRAGSILDVAPDWGRFDYVLCHGVYSWVPDEVREKILSVCRENLAPNGVAYVSYNTYPGWHMRGMLREIMCFHAARYTQAEEQVRQARMLLDFLNEAAGGEGTPYGLLLRQETQMLRQQSDSYLYHEHLEEHNHPCYFFEFAQAAKRHGLQYLGDATFQTMLPGPLAANVQETLQRLALDLIQMEQYLDFVRNRMFRTSLLCAAEVKLVRNIDADCLQDMHLSSTAARAAKGGEGDKGKAAPEDEARFQLEGGGTVTTREGLAAAVLDRLGQAWLASAPFERLAEGLAGKQRLPATAEGRHRLAGVLMNLVANGAVSASVAAARCVAAGEAPVAGPLARYLAAKEGWLPTLRHTAHRLDELGRAVVPLLDGSRGRPALVEHLVEENRKGRLPIREGGTLVRDPARAREILASGLDKCLDNLARSGALAG